MGRKEEMERQNDQSSLRRPTRQNSMTTAKTTTSLSSIWSRTRHIYCSRWMLRVFRLSSELILLGLKTWCVHTRQINVKEAGFLSLDVPARSQVTPQLTTKAGFWASGLEFFESMRDSRLFGAPNLGVWSRMTEPWGEINSDFYWKFPCLLENLSPEGATPTM